MECTLVISCEHAGNNVPKAFHYLFENHQDTLNSHKGWDPGAWPIATEIAKAFRIEAFGEHTTRLLIEPNRSLDSHELFSSYSYSLSVEEKETLIREVYLPYRTRVENSISLASMPVLHLSIHSFTPIFHSIEREVDIGILFDPARPMECVFSDRLLAALMREFPIFSIRFNEPYLGVEDGFTTHLRKKHSNEVYMGIEIEVNQKFLPQTEIITNGLIQAIQGLISIKQ